MKRKSFALFSLMTACILICSLLAGCSSKPEKEPSHTHTYSTDWQSDATHHWHKATCEHTGETSEKSEHVRGDDNKCSVCGYELPALDDGHSLLRADEYEIANTLLTRKDRISKATATYDFSEDFTFSEGATVDIYSSADCSDDSVVNGKAAPLSFGENVFYILVKSSNGAESTLYEVHLYRKYAISVTILYNENDKKEVEVEEDTVLVTALGNNLLENYKYNKYYLDSHYSEELSAELTATEDISLYVDAYYTNVKVSGNSVVGINIAKCPTGKFKVLIDNEILGVTVTSIATNAFWEVKNMTHCIIPDTVSEIGRGAFFCCTSLAEITIPENVTNIGNYAFYSCINLKTVYYNAKNCNDISTADYDEGPFIYDAFSYSYGGASAVIDKFVIGKAVQYIPSNLFATDTYPSSGSGDYYNPILIENLVFEEDSSCLNIGKYAFAYKRCDKSDNTFNYAGVVIGTITLPSSVSEIKSLAFGDTPSAENLYLDATFEKYLALASNSSIAKNVFLSNKLLTDVSVPDSYSAIGAFWFKGLDCIEHVTLPSSINSIPDNAFYSCANLISIDIPSSVNSLGKNAFMFCYSLKEILIPDAVKVIPENCFYGCITLYSLTLPEGLESIDESAFESCYGIVEIYNRSNLFIYGYDFSQRLVNVYTKTSGESKINRLDGGFITINQGDSVLLVGYCGNNKQVVIPNSVNEIGSCVFYRADIESVIISGSVTKIDSNAFNQSKVKNVIINGSSELAIEDNAFMQCENLESLTIGNNVRTIGNEAFFNCFALNVVTLGNKVTRIENNAFKNCASINAVNYTATKVEWGKIEIGDGNTALTEAARTYNYSIEY